MNVPLLAGLLLAATMTPRDQDAVDRHLREILADEQYAFCHDNFRQFPRPI